MFTDKDKIYIKEILKTYAYLYLMTAPFTYLAYKVEHIKPTDDFIFSNVFIALSIWIYIEKVRPLLNEVDIEKHFLDMTQNPKTKDVKGIVNKTPSIAELEKTISEDEALNAAWTKAVQSARIAYREGKKEEAIKWKKELKNIIDEAREKVAKKKKEKIREEINLTTVS